MKDIEIVNINDIDDYEFTIEKDYDIVDKVESIADDEHFTGDIDTYTTDEIINIINRI